MNYLDWILAAIFLLVILLIRLLFQKKGGHDTASSSVAGRKLPGWLAGLSLAATNFGSDTPIQMSSMTRRSGILGCRFSFRIILAQIRTAIIFAKLWRRSEATTDVEFFEMRHAGPGANTLRSCRGLYCGLISAPPFICLFIRGMQYATVPILGLESHPTVDLPLFGNINTAWAISMILVVIALACTATSGPLGVAWTDVIEFGVAIISMYALMIISIREVGGFGELLENMPACFPTKHINFDPTA